MTTPADIRVEVEQILTAQRQRLAESGRLVDGFAAKVLGMLDDLESAPTPEPAPEPTPEPEPTTPGDSSLISTSDALARPNVRSGWPAVWTDQGAQERTYDLRNWSTAASDIYPVKIGNSTPGTRSVVVGGEVVGQASRSLTWREVKARHDGTALLLKSKDWAVVDGFRADNVMDGLRLIQDGSTFVIRNTHHSYIRDDWFENDQLLAGRISNVLIDGCYVFLSCRAGRNSNPSPANGPIIIEHSLIRLERMPYDTDMGGSTPANGSLVNGKGHGQPFKWSSNGPRVEMSDSIIVVPGVCVNGSSPMSFPPGTYRNVTVITDSGKYPRALPGGVKIISDMGVWNEAKSEWLAS